MWDRTTVREKQSLASLGGKHEVEERRKAPEDVPGWQAALPGLICVHPLLHKAIIGDRLHFKLPSTFTCSSSSSSFIQ